MGDVKYLGVRCSLLGCALVAGLGAFGCQNGDSAAKQSNAATGALIDVPAGSLRTGFALGILRDDRSVSSFQISKFPVTWAEFNSCVSAGKCQAPTEPSLCRPANGAHIGYSATGTSTEPSPVTEQVSAPLDQKNDHAPALCVGEAQAEAYCKSINGRLPTLEEWQLAARGSVPRRFAWGDTPTNCEQHPFASQLLARLTTVDTADMSGCVPSGTAISNDQFEVGKHPSGAAPSGMEDVLLAPGELLASSKDAIVRACDGPDGSHCVAFGIVPGAIDAVEPFMTGAVAPGAAPRPTVGHTYSFRCVIAGREVSK